MDRREKTLEYADAASAGFAGEQETCRDTAILACPDTAAGIFSAVYDGWAFARTGYAVRICTSEPENQILFSSVFHVYADTEKSGKVLRSVRRRLGYSVYEAVSYAAVSVHPEKGTAIFRVLWKALEGRRLGRGIMEDLADPFVNLLAKLRIKVWHELHRYYGFVRFRVIGGGILFSRITPENDILPLLSFHFENRFPGENWMIYDAGREKVLIHPAGESCVIHEGVSPAEPSQVPVRADEYEELWREFCRSITIQERKNPALQQQFLPLKFRGNMPEFGKNSME